MIGTSTSSDSEIARCVASRSTGIGRDVAWKRGAVLPARSSRSVRKRMASKFSACTISIAPVSRATDMVSSSSRSDSASPS